MRAEIPRRRADADGTSAGDLLQGVGGSHLKVTFRRLGQHRIALVDPAMDSDLVTFGDYAALLVGIEHRRDGRHEKAGRHRVLREQRENSRDALAVAVLPLAQATDRFAALPQLARVMVAVEGERDSATGAAGPGCGLQ